MVERIRQLLEARKLTPTQFADAIGVARPIVSHILGGRNKPSLEVVQKVIEAFPDLSLAWLLRGVGEMLASSPATDNVTSRPTAPSPEKEATSPADTRSVRQDTVTASRAAERPASTLFNNIDETSEPLIAPVHSNLVKTAPVPAIAALPTPAAAVATSSHASPSVASPTVTQLHSSSQKDSGAMPPSAAIAFAEPNKAIRRIVIFYQDGTFTDYKPEA